MAAVCLSIKPSKINKVLEILETLVNLAYYLEGNLTN